MQKTIIKTAIITVVALALAVLLVYGGFALFAPATLADFYSEMGKEEIALSYNQKVYNANNDANNISRVINSAIICENEEVLVEYFDIAVEKGYDKQFEKEYFNLIAGKYCVAIAKKNQSEAIRTAFSYSEDYSLDNAVRYLIAYGLTESERDLLNGLLGELNNFKINEYQNLSETAKQTLDNDITNLTDYLAN